ncbi:hypothetical protein PMEGAS67_61410 [Priestia megaterium]
MSFYLGMLLRYFYELIYNFNLLAIISISIWALRGRDTTPIVVRAGYGVENCCTYTDTGSIYRKTSRRRLRK